MPKYADETTLYSKALKSDITALENTGCNRDNGMQHAADKAIDWRQSNEQRLYTSKTRYIIMFSLNNKLHDSISIDGESILKTETAKLLGVTIHMHLRFTSHIHTLIGKSRAAVHVY